VIVLGQLVVDSFFANREDYNLATLLARGPLLAEKIFTAGATWHNHVGWFERVEAYDTGIPCLKQLNIDAVRVQEASRQRIRIIISYNQEVRLQAPVSLQQCRNGLDGVMHTLHLKNKALITEILTPEMAARIGLEQRNATTAS
jgi:hypothetical protein